VALGSGLGVVPGGQAGLKRVMPKTPFSLSNDAPDIPHEISPPQARRQLGNFAPERIEFSEFTDF
jgi:hypothetical protein